MIEARDRNHLNQLISQRILDHGQRADLNDIDVSNIHDMSYLFKGTPFRGNISLWDTSNVQIMVGMFGFSYFQGDISQWNTSKVMDLSYMFRGYHYQGNLTEWSMEGLLYHTQVFDVFHDCPLGYLGVLQDDYPFPDSHPKFTEFQSMAALCKGLQMNQIQTALHLYHLMQEPVMAMPNRTEGLSF